MKIVNVIFFFIFSAFIVSSCQKELDFGNFQSTGTLKTDTLFDCLPSSVHGTYTEGSVVTDTNYIEVQVNVALSGNYVIQSDTVNGYSFKGTGSFSTTGLNTVRLFASGTPLLPGPNSFIINYDSSFCIIQIDVIAAVGSAEFTYGGAGGTCTGGGLGGIYMVGLAATASNTDTINVDVISLGSYSITTGDVNGITFSLSGAFTTLGPQTVVLIANGTPVADGVFNFPVSGGNNTGCAFAITFQPPAPPATFTLTASGGNCTAPTFSGTYQATIPVISQNTMTVSVDVSVAGTYNISTAVSNGISFSGSGLFTNIGTQTVVLTASGTPTTAGPTSFTLTGGSGSCNFPLTVDAAPAGIYHCKIDGVDYNFGNNAFATYVGPTSNPNNHLNITGNNIGGIALLTAVNLEGSNQNVAATTYINDVATFAQGDLITAVYDDVNAAHWSPSITTPLDPFTITITSLTTTHVTGTFSGPVHDNYGAGTNVHAITEGVFDLPIN